MDIPSAIIFINSDLNDITLNHLKNQLFIDEIISHDEFNERLSVDPNYTLIVRGQGLRILIILNTFQDFTNRLEADVVIFFKQGQLNIEKNKFGPPNLSFSAQRINIWALLRGAESSNVINLPESTKTLTECDCTPPFGLGGIVAIELRDTGISACKNPDNIYNNKDFINRK
jgi:hypothetical protein